MPALITGIVFNDLANNGVYNVGDPGISGVWLSLYNTSTGTCTTTQTNASGNYSLSVATAGTYTVYETVAENTTCPPTTFTQPTGFTGSNTPRAITLTVTAAQVSGNTTIANNNFGHTTNSNPLACNSTFIQFRGIPSEWINIDLVTGQYAIQGGLTPSAEVNAIGLNPIDNYIYGINITSNSLVRVDRLGNVTTLQPNPTGLPVNQSSGTFDQQGRLFLYNFNTQATTYYVVDLNPNSPTYLKLLDPINGYVEETSNYGTTMTTSMNTRDFAYSPVDNVIYGVGTTGAVLKLIPTTGQVSTLTTIGGVASTAYGAIGIDSNGIMYALRNENGATYRYTISGNTATAQYFSTSLGSSSNDGALCINSAVEVDFGDAPDTGVGNGAGNYTTTLANNGPRHGIINTLYLGTQVTGEPDALQNADATGDDISAGIQDDGLTLPLAAIPTTALNHTLTVTVTNETGQVAHLYGWIDFNKNGVFQGNEAAVITNIPSATGTQQFTLNFTVPSGLTLTQGNTFLRLRLTTQTLTNTNSGNLTLEDTRSIGPASDGEVEDYQIIISDGADLSVTKTVSPNPVVAGSLATYTITVANAGPLSAQNVTVTDNVPTGFNSPEYSLDGGSTWTIWGGSVSLGTVGVGAGNEEVVLIRGTISSSATGTLSNTATVSSTTADPNPSNNTVTIVTNIGTSADLSITKAASPDPVVAGNQATYTITVTNAGPSVAQGVTVTDSVPSGFNIPQYSLDGGTTWNTWTGSVSLGAVTVGVGGAKEVLIRGTVASSSIGALGNTATVSSITTDPDPTNNSVTINTPIDTSANLSIAKSASPDPVIPGSSATYTITVSNAGPSDAVGVTMTDSVPVELTTPEYSLDGGSTWSTWPGSVSLGTIAAGINKVTLIRGSIATNASGTLSNTATVTSGTPDPDPSGNSITIQTTVEPVANLSITKSATPDPVVAGQLATYTLTVTNAGPSAAQAVTVTDSVPTSFTMPEYSLDGGSTWNTWSGSTNLGTVGVGVALAREVLIRGTVSASATGTLDNTASVSSTTIDPDPSGNTVSIRTAIDTSAQLNITKTASPNPAVAGQLVTYTLAVTNSGPSDAQGVTITDSVPAQVSSAEYSVDGGSTWAAWLGSTGVGTIGVGSSKQVQIRGTLSSTSTGNLSNTASVTSTTPDPDPSGNTVTDTTSITTSAHLTLTKTASPNPLVAGAQGIYTLMVTNSGPSVAQNVVLTDSVPASFTSPQYSVDGGTNWNNWTGNITLGMVVVGTPKQVLLRGLVSSSSTGNQSNTASITSTTPDPDPSGWTVTDTTPITTSANVAITKSANPDPLFAGQIGTYILTVTNNGPSDAQGVTVSDTLPSAMSSPEYSLDGGTTWNPWLGSVSIGVVAAGVAQAREVHIRALVDADTTGTIDNTASVSSTTSDPDPSGNTVTITTSVEAMADLAVAKSVTPNPLVAGQTATYTITVQNTGPAVAQNVTVTDTVPTGFNGAEYSLNGGSTWNTWTGSINIGEVEIGIAAAKSVLIRGIVSSNSKGTLENTAAITSTTVDPHPEDNTVTIQTTITTSAQMTITKIATPSPVVAGELATYTIGATNEGPSDAENITIQDNTPAMFTNPEYSVNNGSTWNTWTGSTNIGTVTASSSKYVLLRGIIDSNATGVIENTASLTSTTTDPDPSGNTVTIQTGIDTSADIRITKTVLPSPLVAGQSAMYTVTVWNEGPSVAREVIVTDTLPTDFINAQYSLDGGTTWVNWTGSVDLQTVAANSSEAILIRGTVRSSATGQMSNTATVTSTTPDPTPGDHSVTDTTNVTTHAHLTLTKTVTPNPPVAGALLTYTLTTTNSGPSDAQNVQVADTLPAAISEEEYSVDGGSTWSPWTGSTNVGTVGVGTSKVVLIRGQLRSDSTGQLSNTASLTSTTTDPDPSGHTVTNNVNVSTSADLKIQKTASPNPIIAGAEATYILTLTNPGPSDAQIVTVTDAVPDGFDTPEYSTDGGTTWAPWSGSIIIGTISARTIETVRIRGTVASDVTGNLSNTAEVTSPTPDPHPEDNTVTIQTAIDTSAALEITKIATPTPVVAGELATYTLNVLNSGPSQAVNVTVQDDVSGIMDNPQYSIDGGTTWQAWMGSVNIGVVGVGPILAEQVRIRGTIKSNSQNNVSNTAEVASPTPDPTPANREVTVNTSVTTSAEVRITKTANSDPLVAGNQGGYILVASNLGPSDAQSVQVTDNLDTNFTNAEYSINNGTTWQPWTGSAVIGTLTMGSSRTVLLRGNLSSHAPGTISNTAAVSSPTPNPNPSGQSTTIQTSVTREADLKITKVATPNPMVAGHQVIYTLTVLNEGPAVAENVIITDNVPIGFTSPEFSLDGGTIWNPWAGSINIGTVDVGMVTARTVLLRGVLSSSSKGSQENTATVTSTTLDPHPEDATVTIQTPIITSAHLTMAKVVSPDPVVAGEVSTYTLTATNSGPSDAENVTMMDAVPTNFANPEYSTDGGTTWNTWTGSTNVGTVAAGVARSIRIRGTLQDTAIGNLTNTASVTSTTPDPDPSGSTVTIQTVIDTSADIRITKTVTPSPLVAGQSAIYTITVYNDGPSAARQVVVTDTLPADFTNGQYSVDGGTTWQAWTGTVTLGLISATASSAVLIRGTVRSSTLSQVSNTASVTSTTPDPTPDDHSTTNTTSVDTLAHVTLTKTANPTPAVAGSSLTYTLTATNSGPSDSQNVMISDMPPAVLSGVQYSVDGGTTWSTWSGSTNVGTVVAGASKTVLLRGTVSSNSTGNLSNTASLTSSTTDPDPSGQTVTNNTGISTSADLEIQKSVSPMPVIAGQLATYTLTVTNRGPSAAQSVTVTDNVPVAFTNPEYSTDGGTTWNPWSGTTAVGTLGVGAVHVVRIRGIVSSSATGTLSNTATISSATPDPHPEDSTVTIQTNIATSSALQITKVALPDPVIAGEMATYTVTVQNNGPSQANNVVLQDDVTAFMDAPEYSTDGGSTWSPWTGSVNLGTVGVGGLLAEVVHIRGSIKSSSQTSITNVARVISPTPDPNPNNRQVIVTTTVNTSAEVTITKVANPNPLIAGKQGVYELTATNLGPSDAQGVVVADQVPLSFENPMYSLDQGVTWGIWTGSVIVGTLASGISRTVLVRGSVSPAAPASMSNTASVISTTSNPSPSGATTTIQTSVTQVADLAISKSASPNPMVAGQSATYTLTVMNRGLAVAENVTLTDSVTADFLAPQYSLDGGNSWSAWTGSITLGTVAVDESKVVLIRGNVNSNRMTPLSNMAQVSSTTEDPDPNDNTVTIQTTVNTSARVSITKIASPVPLQAGQMGTYIVTVVNQGPSVARQVTVNDQVPSSFTNPEYSLDGGNTWKPWLGSSVLGDMGVGVSQAVRMRGTISPSVGNSQSNTASVTSTTPNPNPSGTIVTTQTLVNREAHLSIQKTATPTPAVAGEVITYTLTVTNNGPADAQNVVLTDHVPSDVLNPQYSTDAGVTWSNWNGSLSLGTVGLGQTRIVLIRGKINEQTIITLENQAKLTSTTPNPNPGDNETTLYTTVDTSSDLMMTKTVTPSPIVAGDMAMYTLTVLNKGPSAAQNVNVVDALPSQITQGEYSLDGGSTWQTWFGSILLGIVGVGNTEVRTIRIRGQVASSATGNIVNTATALSSTPDPNPEDGTQTITTPVTTRAEVSMTKVATPVPLVAGQMATYILSVTNAGPSDAQNVTVTDAVVSDMLNPQYSLDGGASWSSWTGSVGVGTISDGASQVVHIRGQLRSSTTGNLQNTASFTSTTPNPLPGPHEVSISTPVSGSAEVSIMKTVTPSPVIAGEMATYTLAITNVGPSDARDVAVSDAVDTFLDIPEYSLDMGGSWAAWNGAVSIDVVEATQTKNVLIRGLVKSDLTNQVTNMAQVSSSTPNPNPSGTTTQLTTMVITSADVKMLKEANPNPILAGGMVTYTLTVTNEGPSVAQNVVVNDQVPSGIIQPEYRLNNESVWAPWTGSASIGTVGVGATANQKVFIRGLVSETISQTLSNTASAQSSTPNPNPDDSTYTLNAPVVTSAHTKITKMVNPNPIESGKQAIYTLTVTNEGPSTARQVIVEDQVPTEFMQPQYSLDGGNIWSTWLGSIALGDIEGQGSRIILIRGMMNPNTVGTISNTAKLTTTTPNPNPEDEQTTLVSETQGEANLKISKNALPSPLKAGVEGMYTLIVTNEGPAAAQGVVVEDQVNMNNPVYSLNQGISWETWNGSVLVGTVDVGQIVTVLIKGILSPSALTEQSNTATLISPTPNPNPGDNTTTIETPVETSAHVTITKESAPIPVIAGNLITYTLTVQNQGPADAQNVVVQDTLPGTIEKAVYSTDGGNTWEPWLGSTILGVVPASATQTVLIRGEVNSATTSTIENRASLTTTTNDPDSSGHTVVQQAQVITQAELKLTKTVEPSPVIAGAEAVYTLTLVNLGPSDAQNVVVQDEAPLEAPQYSLDGGSIWQSWRGSVPLGVVAMGATQAILIKGRVQVISTGTLTNKARVTASTPNPNPDGAISEIVTPIGQLTELIIMKEANPNPLVAGAEGVYMLTVTNKGPSRAENVVVKDQVTLENPEYTLEQSQVWQPWNEEVLLGMMDVDSQKVVRIRGRVPANITNKVENTAKVQSSTPQTGKGGTVVVETTIQTSAKLKITKTATPNIVQRDDMLTYTLLVFNEGPSDAQQVRVKDDMPESIENPEYSLNQGVTWSYWNQSVEIGNIPVNTQKTLLIRGRVGNNVTGPITNTAQLETPTPNPDPSGATSTTTTGTIRLEMIKTASQELTIIDETITYTLNISNQGTVAIEQIIVSDQLSSALSYENNLRLNGVSILGSILTGVNIGNLVPGQSKVLTFDAKIVSVPQNQNITNQGKVIYVTPTGETLSTNSNICTIQAYEAKIDVIKTARPQYLRPGDTLIYPITVTNTGEVLLTEVILKDILPGGVSLTQIKVEGEVVQGSLVTGIPLGDLPVGVVKYVDITTVVQPNIKSASLINTVEVEGKAVIGEAETIQRFNVRAVQATTRVVAVTATAAVVVELYDANMVIQKRQNKNNVAVGEEVIYTLEITNPISPYYTSVPITDVLIIDQLSSELEFIEGSIQINGISKPQDNLYTGILIETLAVGETKRITFKARVIAQGSGKVVNSALGEYSCEVPGEGVCTKQTQSNEVVLNIYSVVLNITKQAHNTYAKLYQTIIYTIEIINAGELALQNILLKDVLDHKVTMVPGSFKINGTNVMGVNLSKGYLIPVLMVQEKLIVEFVVNVTSIDCTKGCCDYVANQVDARYEYILPDQSKGIGIAQSNEVRTRLVEDKEKDRNRCCNRYCR